MYSNEEIRAKLEERKRIGDQCREITRAASAEKRSLTGEESGKFDELLKRADDLKAEADRMSRANGLFGDLDGTPRFEPEVIDEESRSGGPKAEQIEAEYRAAFSEWIGTTAVQSEAEARSNLAQLIRNPEVRSALMLADGPRAGFVVPPVFWLRELIKNIDDEHVLMGLVRKIITPMGQQISTAKRLAKAVSFRRGGELGPPVADTTLRYGQFTINPQNAWGEILVSNDLLEAQGLVDVEAEVRGELARDAGDGLEQEILTGDGGAECLGLFTASDEGIPTSRDFTVGSTTAVTVAGLRAVKYGLKAAYWPKAQWIGSRDFHKQVFGLEDGEQRPLFMEALKEGEPDRLMGRPIRISEFAPATFTASQYVCMFGVFEHYWLAISRDFQIKKLIELYARQNQTSFMYGMKVHGGPTKAEAFARGQLASGG